MFFFGTPLFAFHVLESLKENGHTILAVVTKPDAVNHGRTTSPPIKKKLCKDTSLQSIPIMQPPKMRDPDFQNTLRSLNADLFVVVMFGKILPSEILYMPRHHCINIHPSLLPKYRGVSPVRTALLNGDTQTGVSIMTLVEEMDAGDVYVQESLPIPSNMNHDQLENALLKLSVQLLLKVLSQLEKNTATLTPQDHTQATFTKKITPQSCHINVNESVSHVHDQIRALSATPGAYVYVQIDGHHKRLKILEAEVIDYPGTQAPKLIIDNNVLIMVIKEGALQLKQVQLEGKKVVNAKAFTCGVSTPSMVIK